MTWPIDQSAAPLARFASGVEVMRIPQVGWGVYSFHEASGRDLLSVHQKVDAADRKAERDFQTIRANLNPVIERPATLQLSGDSDAKPS